MPSADAREIPVDRVVVNAALQAAQHAAAELERKPHNPLCRYRLKNMQGAWLVRPAIH